MAWVFFLSHFNHLKQNSCGAEACAWTQAPVQSLKLSSDEDRAREDRHHGSSCFMVSQPSRCASGRRPKNSLLPSATKQESG